MIQNRHLLNVQGIRLKKLDLDLSSAKSKISFLQEQLEFCVDNRISVDKMKTDNDAACMSFLAHQSQRL
jgi:hypothetical protein